MRNQLFLAGLAATLVAALVIVQRARPNPLPAVPVPIRLQLKSSSTSSQPEITWAPNSITESIPAGQSKTITLSFQASRDLDNVALRVVPELQPFIQVVPQIFPQISGGQNITVKAIISVPSLLPPEAIQGTLQLRSLNDTQYTIARPLPVTLNVVWTSYQNSQLGFGVSVPPSFISKQSTDPVVKQVVFLKPPGSSEGDVMVLVKFSNLPQGLSLAQAIQAGGIDAGSIDQVTIGGRTYLKWFSTGEGDGNWSYATLYSQSQSISVSTPSSSFASSSAFLDVVASLTFPAQ